MDALAKLASTKDVDLLDVIPVEFLAKPSIDFNAKQEQVLLIQQYSSWIDPLLEFLKHSKLPTKK